MAYIGLSKPTVAVYSNVGTAVTYTAAKQIGKAVEMSIELEGDDKNVLYADNGIAETANSFMGGEMELTTDSLDSTILKDILGIEEESISPTEGIQTEMPKWYNFNDSMQTPYVGFGAIAKVQKDGIVKYKAVILNKIQFKTPSDTFKTQGETTEWGTPKISATIMRDDTAKHGWKKESSLMDTEADALAAITAFFGAK